MAKKEASVVDSDSPKMPSKRQGRHVEGSTFALASRGERRTQRTMATTVMAQCNIEMRRSLKKELMRLALDSDMTMQAFVLSALKAKGLSVTDLDLVDRRRQKG